MTETKELLTGDDIEGIITALVLSPDALPKHGLLEAYLKDDTWFLLRYAEGISAFTRLLERLLTSRFSVHFTPSLTTAGEGEEVYGPYPVTVALSIPTSILFEGDRDGIKLHVLHLAGHLESELAEMVSELRLTEISPAWITTQIGDEAVNLSFGVHVKSLVSPPGWPWPYEED